MTLSSHKRRDGSTRPLPKVRSLRYGSGEGNEGQRSGHQLPFTETRELIVGFWLWKVMHMAEAVEWVKHCPNPMPGPSEIEIRPVFETADFGDALTPELAAQEDRIREKAARR
jgi:hypothetical protein